LGNNPHHRQVAKELANKTGLKIVTLRHLDYFTKTDENFGDYAPYDVDPQRFLNILRNAKYVLTDSFHGMAFSVICEKQFLVFDRYNKNSKNSKNSRIESVCENLNLQERHFDLNDDITEIITKPIDYTAVLKMVEEYRQKTKDYLKTTLNNNV
jgi:exopolysaccharide biosynthesis predicted pyruvyltransferase EpsI